MKPTAIGPARGSRNAVGTWSVGRRLRARSGRGRNTALAWLLFAPALLWVVVVTIAPIVEAIQYSLYRTNFTQRLEFIGLDNYAKVFTAPDSEHVLTVTVVYVGASLVLAFVVSLGLAYLLSLHIRGLTAFRTLLMLPWVTSGLLAGLLWKWTLSPLVGPLPYTIADVTGQQSVDPLSTGAGAMATLIGVSVWKIYPFGMVLLLASMRTIPLELYESASVDGAGRWAQFRHITVPALRNTSIVVASFFTIALVTMAEVPLVITGGGPNGATDIAGLHLYLTAFQFLDNGGASAYAVVLFGVNVVLGGLYIRFLRNEDA
jgi:ABC-type sugar transport system permease subunit